MIQLYEEFVVHKLNQKGLDACGAVATAFNNLLSTLEGIWGDDTGRSAAIVRTKLEEASFFAKKTVAQQNVYQA